MPTAGNPRVSGADTKSNNREKKSKSGDKKGNKSTSSRSGFTLTLPKHQMKLRSAYIKSGGVCANLRQSPLNNSMKGYRSPKITKTKQRNKKRKARKKILSIDEPSPPTRGEVAVPPEPEITVEL